ncbi:MAG TPA: S-layer homology domain-containing protein [Candidatus Agathobaculum merdavium]|nr:S-layer homology domain-containing protein [Candidatus Agathobaculum merdavium]
MKQKFRIVLVSMLLVVGMLVAAGASSYDHCADQLKALGLFQGTEQGYELDRAPTRAEAATMLVRLLGKEADAQKLEYTAPFTDLEDWQKPYVQYLYDNELTSGATETTFEPESLCSAQMYTTFLLRALGYSDAEAADFTYQDAITFGESIGLVDYANCNQQKFLRDHIAAMSLTALNTAVKGDEDTVLLEKLVADGAVAQADAKDLLAFFDSFNSYVKASEQMSAASQSDMTMSIAASVDMDDVQVMSLDMPIDVKLDMDMEQMDQSKIAMTGKVKVEMNEELVDPGMETKVEQDIAYYYTDGVLYMNMGGQKVKMDMSFEDMMQQMGDLSAMQKTEPICMIDSIEKSGNTSTVTYSASGMNGLIDSVLQNMGMTTADMGVAIDDMSAKVTVSNDMIKTMDVAMKFTMTVEDQTMTMDMTVNCTVNKLGSGVTVTLPSDLDTYEEMTGGADAPAA